jgi:hypothetical protein
MLAYCDYIAHVIRQGLKADKSDFRSYVAEVGNVIFDLGPNGEFASTRKTITVYDVNNKKYLITVEEV